MEGTGQDDASYLLTISPNASAFIVTPLIPIEFKVSYGFPLMGENANASRTFVIQFKSYMKFY